MYTIDLTSPRYRDQVLGCWIGKNCGGTLGAPLEQVWGESEPLDVWWYPELREGGIPNDDLEMQLVWLKALEEIGPRLTARDLAQYWLDHIGYNWDEYGFSKTNLKRGLQPPLSGSFDNWFADCMGSPIRSEIWACVTPGVPRLAARMAYIDAICDHAGGEGVYGELFNAAVESAAFVIGDPHRLIEIGLTYIPEWSATALAIRTAVAAHAEGLDWKGARQRVLAATPSHVAQYAPINLGFQAIGWLYGEDFGHALCVAVNCGYDTDCTGATLGSFLGIVAGAAELPEKWVAPLGDEIATNSSWGGVQNLFDHGRPIPSDLHDLTDRTIAMAHKVLRDAGRLDEHGRVLISEDELVADESIRELWTADVATIDFPEAHVRVQYTEGPIAVPGESLKIVAHVANPSPREMVATLEVAVPEGWAVIEPVEIQAAPRTEVAVPVEIHVPDRGLITDTDTAYLSVREPGRPPRPGVPVAMLGAHATLVSGPHPLTEAPAFDTATAPTSLEWRPLVAGGNQVPVQALFDGEGVLYVKTYFDSTERIEGMLGVEAPCPVLVWFNGELVVSAPRHRPIRPSYWGKEDTYKEVVFEPGMNEVVVALVSDSAQSPELHVVATRRDRIHDPLLELRRTQFPVGV